MQHDLNLADQAGAAFRADLNNALSALATNNGGATAPAATYANMWWADEATNILKRRNEANTAWINVMSLTLAISTYSETILVAANAATALLTLGAAPLANPTLTGIPRAPTAAVGTNSTQLATTAFVGAEVAFDLAAALAAAGYTTPAGVKAQFNAAGAAPVYACRAWVNFNGQGTVAIMAGGNVSSITDRGVGAYTVNFAIGLPDAYYAAAGFMRSVLNNGTSYVINSYSSSQKTGTAFEFTTKMVNEGATGDVDSTDVNIMFFR